MADTDIDVKQELKDLRQKVKSYNNLFDYNTISYTEFIPFIFKVIKKFDNRLDVIENKLDAIEKAFADSLTRFPPPA